MAHTKTSIRRSVRDRRAAVSPADRAARDRAIHETLRTVVTAGTVVCAYVPDDDEAGGRGLPATLTGAGARVLLPVSPLAGPLGWAEYTDDDDLRTGRFGIPVPSADPGPPELIAGVDLVLVPAVAVDRAGNRLGRGGGYYDRSLALAHPDTRLLAVLDPEDVLDTVPVEAHDRPVHGVVTPGRVLTFPTWHSAE